MDRRFAGAKFSPPVRKALAVYGRITRGCRLFLSRRQVSRDDLKASKGESLCWRCVISHRVDDEQ